MPDFSRRPGARPSPAPRKPVIAAVAIPLTLLESALIHLDGLVIERPQDRDLLNTYCELRAIVRNAGGIVP